MANAPGHTKGGLATAGLLALGAIAFQNPSLLDMSLGATLGTFYLNPDLDLKISMPTHNWGPLSLIWLPYNRAFPHRSFWSHSPLISTVIRIAYVWGWAGFCGWVLRGNGYYVSQLVSLPSGFWMGVCWGLGIQDVVHIWLDGELFKIHKLKFHIFPKRRKKRGK